VGGATAGTNQGCPFSLISIHAPRGGSDGEIWGCQILVSEFQSTLPVGGATAPEGSLMPTVSFQSTLPVGGATKRMTAERDAQVFQSTLPVGGATQRRTVRLRPTPNFNPRSPWGERRAKHPGQPGALYFNPRSPWGERLLIPRIRIVLTEFQSTLPVGGATGGPSSWWG